MVLRSLEVPSSYNSSSGSSPKSVGFILVESSYNSSSSVSEILFPSNSLLVSSV